MDGLFWRELRTYLTDKDYLRVQAEEWLTSEINHNKTSALENEKLLRQIDKAKEEQERYARAYGAETLDFEQFKDLMKESRKKAEVLGRRLNELSEAANKEVINPKQLDRLCEEAKKVVDNFNLDDKKRLIGDIIDKVTVHTDGRVETLGHLPLFAQSWDNKLNVTQELGLYAASWNCWFTKRWEKHFV